MTTGDELKAKMLEITKEHQSISVAHTKVLSILTETVAEIVVRLDRLEKK